MFSVPEPRRQEIDARTIKLLVGVIAISMAGITSYFANTGIGPGLDSISASYYAGGWSQTFFIGLLFAIAAFMLAYNGRSRAQMIMSKIAAIAALGVALYPCKCDTHDEISPHVHGISAAVLFMVLAFFCWVFYRRARGKGHAQAQIRATIYLICGAGMLVSILVLAIGNFSGAFKGIPRITFYGEALGLVSFGVSWLVSSRVLPGLSREDERFSPLRADNPPD
jgi:uncharacterized membrane protein YiaA